MPLPFSDTRPRRIRLPGRAPEIGQSQIAEHTGVRQSEPFRSNYFFASAIRSCASSQLNREISSKRLIHRIPIRSYVVRTVPYANSLHPWLKRLIGFSERYYPPHISNLKPSRSGVLPGRINQGVKRHATVGRWPLLAQNPTDPSHELGLESCYDKIFCQDFLDLRLAFLGEGIGSGKTVSQWRWWEYAVRIEGVKRIEWQSEKFPSHG